MHVRVYIYMCVCHYVFACMCVRACMHDVHAYAFGLHSYNFIHVHACMKLYVTLVCIF